MNNFIVYKHTCPNGKIYIGITCQKPNKRWNSGYKNNKYFTNAINKYDWGNIQHEILFENLTKEQAEQKEIELIAFYKSNQRKYGYNIENGGNSNGKHSIETLKKISQSNKGKIVSENVRKKISQSKKGYKATIETKRKISQSNKGRISPMKNKHLNQETKNKISKSLKGRPSKLKGKPLTVEHKENIRKNCVKYWQGKKLSKETCEKIRKANLGRKLSDETRKKLSKIHKGHIVSDETREKIRKANTGKHHTQETKEKMRKAKLKKEV